MPQNQQTGDMTHIACVFVNIHMSLNHMVTVPYLFLKIKKIFELSKTYSFKAELLAGS